MKKESYEKLKALIESDDKMRDSFLKLSEEGKSELIDRLFGTLVHKKMVEKFFKRENERKDELRLISIKKEAMKAARLQIRKSIFVIVVFFLSYMLLGLAIKVFSNLSITYKQILSGSLWMVGIVACVCLGGVVLTFLQFLKLKGHRKNSGR